MAFDIYQQVFDRDGLPFEKMAEAYIDQLMELFVQSPEGQQLWSEGIEPGWASMMMDFGMNYLSLTPPHMSPDDLREVLFDLVPRKVSTSADDAEEIVRELRAFWSFLQREFHLENAEACLKLLDERAVRELKKQLGNPANFGIAKSFVMMGMERGFDLSSEEGINRWMETYNNELAAGTGLRIPLPGERSESTRQFQDRIKPVVANNKRKKNRKRNKRK
ncbi:MAG TPA: hypothetical protein VKR06_37260 [Ktedonosporobacter sp.]|nr:hypothetical protein [Ktedonosporobacter sp.]